MMKKDLDVSAMLSTPGSARPCIPGLAGLSVPIPKSNAGFSHFILLYYLYIQQWQSA
jgi:hypothetical protein